MEKLTTWGGAVGDLDYSGVVTWMQCSVGELECYIQRLSTTPQVSIMTAQFGSAVSDFHSTVLVWCSWHSWMKTELVKSYKVSQKAVDPDLWSGASGLKFRPQLWSRGGEGSRLNVREPGTGTDGAGQNSMAYCPCQPVSQPTQRGTRGRPRSPCSSDGIWQHDLQLRFHV